MSHTPNPTDSPVSRRRFISLSGGVAAGAALSAPFVQAQPAKIKVVMPDVFHTLRPGHRLMVQVHSSWFPLADRNPQKFTDIYTAGDQDFQKQTHRVYRGGAEASGISVRLMSK